MYEELKKLAEGMKGWDKMDACWPCDENGPDWKVGRLDEDDNRWPLLTIDTAEYDQEQDAPKIARYYAAANPSAVLALIADREALDEWMDLAERRAQRIIELGEEASRLKAENEALRKDAERFRFIQQDADSGMRRIYGDDWLEVVDADGFQPIPDSGHGHVFPRADWTLARCGGPGLCIECRRDAEKKARQ